jgi:hypothetical protein
MANSQELRSQVWLLKGMTGSEPGVLTLSGGVLSFATAAGPAFEAAADRVGVKFPWYYFGGGCKVTLPGGVTHRISFVRPNGAEDMGDGPLALLTAAGKLSDIGQGRALGKAWKSALASRIGTKVQ